jgi:hypothetical protein
VVQEFGGSFQGFVEAFQRRYNYDGTALQLAQMVTDTFPSFRDEHWFEGRRSQYRARIPNSPSTLSLMSLRPPRAPIDSLLLETRPNHDR